MATSTAARPVEEAWRKLEGTLGKAMKPDEKGVTHDAAMLAMSAVHDYCTGSGGGSARARQTGDAGRYGQQAQGTHRAGAVGVGSGRAPLTPLPLCLHTVRGGAGDGSLGR